MAAKSSRFPADVGQGTELDGLEEKALKTGASKLYIEDLTKDFVDDYIIPTMKAGATYEQYLLGTSFARPIIAKRIVDIALKEGADAICHGCNRQGQRSGSFRAGYSRICTADGDYRSVAFLGAEQPVRRRSSMRKHTTFR